MEILLFVLGVGAGLEGWDRFDPTTKVFFSAIGAGLLWLVIMG